MDGINIQFLDGVDSKKTNELSNLHNFVMEGYSDELANEMDVVADGLDLQGFEGNGNINDQEMLHSYLVRTKKCIDKYPQAIMGYQNPKIFSQMLGFVLDNWDNGEREAAIDNMAREEERLIKIGAINLDFAQDEDDVEVVSGVVDEDEYTLCGVVTDTNQKVVRRKKHKCGFFNMLKEANGNTNISPAANKIISDNPFLSKIKTRMRKNVAKNRRNCIKNVTNKMGEKVAIKQNVADAQSVKGLGNANQLDIDELLRGVDFEEENALSGVNGTELKNYLQRTKNVLLANQNSEFEDEDERDEVIGQIDYLLDNYNIEKNREKALSQLSGENMTEDQYDDFIGAVTERRQRKNKRMFFKNIKEFSKNPSKNLARTITANNPFVLRKKVANKMAENGLSGGALDFDELLKGTDLLCAVSGLGATNGKEAVRNYLNRTRKVIAQTPCYDYETDYDNAQGVLSYAVKNLDNEEAMNTLCGVGMNDSEYEQMEDYLGALGAKKTKAQKKAEKAQKKAEKKAQKAKEKAEKAKEKAEHKAKQKAFKAEQKELKQKIKNAKTKEEKKALKKEKRQKYWKNVKENAKRIGKKIKKVLKKIVKFIIKYNPLCLMIRGGLLLCLQLNMFKLALKTYYGSIPFEQAQKQFGLTKAEHDKLIKGYQKLKNVYVKLGGTEKVLLKNLEKGVKRVWKGSEKYSLDTLKKASDKNKASLQKMVDTEEAALTKAGATKTNDPKTFFDIKKEEKQEVVNVEVDVDENGNEIPNTAKQVAQSAVNGLMRNNYLCGGLGEPVTTAAIASAGTVIAGIIGALGGIFGKDGGKIMEKLKGAVKKVKDVFSKTKVGQKITSAISNIKEKNLQKQAEKQGISVEELKAKQAEQSAKLKNLATNAKTFFNDTKKVVKTTVQSAKDVANTVKSVVKENNAKANRQTSKATTASNAPTAEKSGNSKKILVAGALVAGVGVATYFIVKKNKKN